METLISIRGKMDEDFVKNARKQGALKFSLFQFQFFISNFGLRLIFILIYF